MKTLPAAKTVDVCGGCGERVTIPPGVYYRGVPYHRQEAEHKRRIDLTHEQLAPARDETERQLREILE